MNDKQTEADVERIADSIEGSAILLAIAIIVAGATIGTGTGSQIAWGIAAILTFGFFKVHSRRKRASKLQ